MITGAPETIRYESGGLSAVAYAWGQAGAPLALLLHGYPDTAWTWRYLGPALAERGFRAVAPFMRGYHPTSLGPHGSYEIGALVRDALGAHEVLGGDGRAVLVGHDWGAEAAYATDAFAPGIFRRVVALSVPPGPALDKLPRHPRLLLRQLPRLWYVVLMQLPGTERLQSRLIPRLWRAWSPGYDGREDARRALAALAPSGHRTAALRYYRAVWRQPRATSAEYAREQKQARSLGPAPTLYLHGKQDGCMLAGVARLAVPYVETEIIPGVGHFLHLEAPEAVNAKVIGFLTA